jgi:hypothetical protein
MKVTKYLDLPVLVLVLMPSTYVCLKDLKRWRGGGGNKTGQYVL